MSVLNEAIGRSADIPLLKTLYCASATAGTGTDFEHIVFVVPDLSQISGGRPQRVNAVDLRLVSITPEANITGANTNYMDIKVQQRRGGSVLNTLVDVSFQSGTNATAWTPLWVVPTAGNQILPGDVITVARASTGTGLASPNFTVTIEYAPANSTR